MQKNLVLSLLLVALCTITATAQKISESKLPEAVKTAFAKKYTVSEKVSWEKEKGNYEANWGGKSGEDHAALFAPDGTFIEIVDAIPVAGLPSTITQYVKSKYNNASIKEAGKLTDASGKKMYEIEVKGKDVIFDEAGNFLREETD
jgi:hypothetical protein